jgi:DNA-binding XRE family transcriptional regulator
MDALYVCAFSNGAIKVGRSSDPDSRIAQHEERVACLGVLLNEKRAYPFTGYYVQAAEAELIARCTQHATSRHKSEWFTGLDFEEVCDWARELCDRWEPRADQEADSFGYRLAKARRKAGLTQADLAKGLGVGGRDLQKAAVSSWENNTCSPNVEQLRLICARLGVTPNHLVLGEPVERRVQDAHPLSLSPVTPASTCGASFS